jgi:hypothetical protein
VEIIGLSSGAELKGDWPMSWWTLRLLFGLCKANFVEDQLLGMILSNSLDNQFIAEFTIYQGSSRIHHKTNSPHGELKNSPQVKILPKPTIHRQSPKITLG